MKTTKHEKPFLAIEYDLLGINSVEVNGEIHDVKLHHKIIYSYLQSLSGTFQQVTPSLTGIGKRLGLGTDQTVRRHIKDLVSFGWLSTVERPGCTNIFTVLPYAPEAKPKAPEEVPAPTMTKVIDKAVIVSESAPESVVTTTESDQAVIDEDMALEIVCKRLSQPESLRQSQRYDTFTAYARRVLLNDGKRLSSRFEKRLEERFEQLHPHLYKRFDDIGF
ncbi:helix-turn-helix domain-containing protein [Cronobacter sakazakii]|uniref:helix-turn-helix domain-containing protein n=1 Tax=Cronobacter sakazakii TaxID=28141 RepID=UPI0009489B73|nr:helix-turn-helix domain-containing protein [Cronobacter sakazakii]PUX38386.1 helix-turn-helix domain-containing protein [Cronobacter sakazakii]PUX54001.1 helix-turn-helix domain-containing protein [Cronobacter sakazakii]PUX62836.1 helix-turn-helix domain-containing protein [Cronobacter sakazakii]PUX63224.1 helix-turn-helix domain-containing protein [Cronobacter sakazakii]